MAGAADHFVNEDVRRRYRAARRVFVLANRRAGSKSVRPHVDELLHRLESRKWDVEICWELERLVAGVEAAQATGDLRAVIAAGGDGTLALAANHVAEGTPLIHFPLGTENLFARKIGFRADPYQTADVLERGRLAAVDAGEANGKLFLLMVGIGFDGEIVHAVHSRRTGHVQKSAYYQAILQTLWTYPYPALRISFEPHDSAAALLEAVSVPAPTVSTVMTAAVDAPVVSTIATAPWAFVFNAAMYAGGIPLAPLADPQDGKLDLITFDSGGFLSSMNYLSRILLRPGRPFVGRNDVHVRSVRVECDFPVRYQTDGDAGGLLPVDVRVLPGRLCLLTPPEFSADVGVRSFATLGSVRGT